MTSPALSAFHTIKAIFLGTEEKLLLKATTASLAKECPLKLRAFPNISELKLCFQQVQLRTHNHKIMLLYLYFKFKVH